MKIESMIESRLDLFLSSIDALDISRSFAQKLIEDSRVKVNERIAKKSSHKIFPRDQIEIDLPPVESLEILPENLPLDILYEDQDLLVVNKARGMTVHPAAGNFSGTLVNALLFHCKNLSGINGIARPGIVHRLDKDTSGVMLVAKNDLSHRSLADQIQKKSARRIYLAIVHGNFSIESGVIEGAIGRDPRDRQKMAIVPNGKPATTNFKVIENFYAQKLALIECRLETGRTHQIRVHMTSIGHPLLGDPKYFPNKKKPTDHFQIDGQALHSWKIEFRHPRTNQILKFTAEIPSDMLEILRKLKSKFIE